MRTTTAQLVLPVPLRPASTPAREAASRAATPATARPPRGRRSAACNPRAFLRDLRALIAGQRATTERAVSILQLGCARLGTEIGMLVRVDGDGCHVVCSSALPGWDDALAPAAAALRAQGRTPTAAVVSAAGPMCLHGEQLGAYAVATPCARYVGAPVVVDGAPWGVLEFYALDHTDRAQARLPQVSARRSRGPGLAAADEDALIVLAGLIGHAVAHERCEDALARASADLARLTEIDPLTQLQNRRGVETTLRRLARRQLHGGGSFTALLVDLDDFKHINDTFGHATGDDVLAKTAALIQSVVRPTDVVGRIGGDEFLALLPGANLEQAQGVAERVRAALASDSIVVFGGTVTVTVTASIGVAEIRTEACTVKDILARTSDLLRESKRAGKNRLSCA